MSPFFIRPTDQARRDRWLDLLATDRLPIVDPRPRPGQGGGLVYDVDTSSLSELQRARLAAVAAQQQRAGYLQALESVTVAGVAVPALGCELLSVAGEAVGDL